jgi:hypothetical protein
VGRQTGNGVSSVSSVSGCPFRGDANDREAVEPVRARTARLREQWITSGAHPAPIQLKRFILSKNGTTMGMDVYGYAPNNEPGKYFGMGALGWYPLADYLCEIAPEITSKCRYWRSNDSDGLNGEDSMLLADLLQKEIDSGRSEKYVQLFHSQNELPPDGPCPFCHGTGIMENPTLGPSPEGSNKGGIVCIICSGERFIGPAAAQGEFSAKNLQKFAAYLRCCGGFQIC